MQQSRHHQWWIYIQKFLVHAPHKQDQILSFLHMFSPKSACVRGWRPLQQGLAPPQWEILDPPLIIIQEKDSERCLIIDVAMSSDYNIQKKATDKMSKYVDLQIECQ